MIVREVPWDDTDADCLRIDQQAEISARYGSDTEPGTKPSASDITVFFVAYIDGVAAGCGGLRQLDDSHAEIKRMYVAPGFRGTGVASGILSSLEAYGRERGWERLVLETGNRQPDAIKFYEREGFARIPNFGYYADSAISLCYEKAL
jgi:GNAT superfamily N-acetyltransferase